MPYVNYMCNLICKSATACAGTIGPCFGRSPNNYFKFLIRNSKILQAHRVSSKTIWITAPKLVRANSCNAFLVANEEKMAQSHVPTKNNENNQELPDSQETLVLQGDEPPAPVPKQEERPRSDHLQGDEPPAPAPEQAVQEKPRPKAKAKGCPKSKAHTRKPRKKQSEEDRKRVHRAACKPWQDKFLSKGCCGVQRLQRVQREAESPQLQLQVQGPKEQQEDEAGCSDPREQEQEGKDICVCRSPEHQQQQQQEGGRRRDPQPRGPSISNCKHPEGQLTLPQYKNKGPLISKHFWGWWVARNVFVAPSVWKKSAQRPWSWMALTSRLPMTADLRRRPSSRLIRQRSPQNRRVVMGRCGQIPKSIHGC